MDRCKICGSFAINEHTHGRANGKHPDLCDVCYWREEAELAYRAGYDAGVTKGMLRAAEIADSRFKYEDGYCHYREDVGDAIRKEAGE